MTQRALKIMLGLREIQDKITPSWSGARRVTACRKCTPFANGTPTLGSVWMKSGRLNFGALCQENETALKPPSRHDARRQRSKP